MQKARLQHSQPAIFLVVFGSGHIGMSLQRHHTQWNWTFGTTFFGSGLVPSQGDLLSLRFPRLAVVSLSKSASQRSTAKSYIRKKGRWEKGWGKTAPELCLQQCRGLQGGFRGSFIPQPLFLLGSPERQHSPCTFPVGILCSQQNP